MGNSLDKFGVPLPSGRQAMKQPKPQYRFRVVLFAFGATGDGDQVSFETNSVSLPTYDYDAIVVNAYNSKMNYKGKYTLSTFDLAIRDSVGNGPLRAVMNQVRKEFDHFAQESRATGAQYKFECWIQSLDGSDTSERATGDLFAGTFDTTVLQGCMINSFAKEAFDYSSSEASTITLTIQADNMVTLDENGNPMGDNVEATANSSGLSTVASNHNISSDAFSNGDGFDYSPDIQ